jgi:hypothetical protein
MQRLAPSQTRGYPERDRKPDMLIQNYFELVLRRADVTLALQIRCVGVKRNATLGQHKGGGLMKTGRVPHPENVAPRDSPLPRYSGGEGSGVRGPNPRKTLRRSEGRPPHPNPLLRITGGEGALRNTPLKVVRGENQRFCQWFSSAQAAPASSEASLLSAHSTQAHHSNHRQRADWTNVRMCVLTLKPLCSRWTRIH